MVLTPADVANKQFRNSFRGYNEDEVDTFLDTVEAELVRLLTDNAALQARVEEFERGVRPSAAKPVADGASAAGQPAGPQGEQPRSGSAAFFAGPSDARAESRPDARADAPSAPSAPAAPSAGGGEAAALRTLQLAQRTADAAVAEAQAEAEALLRSAQERSKKMDQDVQSRQKEVLGTLDSRRRQLEKHIDDLRAYEREYRSRLRAYLEAQLRQLAGQAVAAPGSPPPAPPDPRAGDRLTGTGPDGSAAPAPPADRPGNGSTPAPATAPGPSAGPGASSGGPSAGPPAAPTAPPGAPTAPPPPAAGPPRQATPFRPGPTTGDAGTNPPPAPDQRVVPPATSSGS